MIIFNDCDYVIIVGGLCHLFDQTFDHVFRRAFSDKQLFIPKVVGGVFLVLLQLFPLLITYVALVLLGGAAAFVTSLGVGETGNPGDKTDVYQMDGFVRNHISR